jgi:hypothetical protein
LLAPQDRPRGRAGLHHTPAPARRIRGDIVSSDNANSFTSCLRCEKGVLLPLSDYGRDGAPIRYKAWVCSNPDCGFNIRIDNGEISFGRDLGQSHK